MEKLDAKMYQVSTLNALALGYTRKVVTVDELLRHGSIGLGTFESVDGEMIVLDGRCYRATDDGSVIEVDEEKGVSFASVTFLRKQRNFDIENITNVDALKSFLDLRIEENFGLNSMHVIRIDGTFEMIDARSENAYNAHHVELKNILKTNQKSFKFENITGTLVCLYHPDFMQGINAAGWHFHFISSDRTKGGHVFDLRFRKASAILDKVSKIEIQLPKEPAFDTYSLTQASNKDIKKAGQCKS